MILPRHPRGLSSGLTLIELMVSSVLAVILMVTVLSFMRAVWAEKDRTVSAGRELPAQRMGELLRRDMLHARGLAMRPNTVSLIGFLAHDLRSRTPTYRPAVVTYRVVGGASGRLLREERHLDEMPPMSFVDVVWSGVRSIEVTAFDESADQSVEEQDVLTLPPGMSRMPSQLLVIVRGADGRPLCREEIVHHARF